MFLFQSTPPAREATHLPQPPQLTCEFQSTPPRAGRRRRSRRRNTVQRKFQSTPPAREATLVPAPGNGPARCFNPRLPRGRRQNTSSVGGLAKCFQSTPPRGRRLPCCIPTPQVYVFQSTPPAREATYFLHLHMGDGSGFNPRLPRGGDGSAGTPAQLMNVSIHASRAGGDQDTHLRPQRDSGFNPRLPRGRATRLAPVAQLHIYDVFNPRLPRGRRTVSPINSLPSQLFQSTPPAREATACPLNPLEIYV